MLSILPPGMTDSSEEELSDNSEYDDSARPGHDDVNFNSLEQEVQDGKSSEPPRGVSHVQWRKFLDLQKDREQIPSTTEETRRPRKRRRRKRQSNKRDDMEEYGGSCTRKDDGHPSASSSLIGPQLPGQPSRYPGQPPGHEWKEIKEYLGVYDRFKGVNYGKVSDMSGLEKEINSAITAKDFKTVEKLSDQLANRDFGTKINDAIKAKEYVDNKEKEKMEKSKRKKKRKLAWRFEAKERWEMKGNM